MYVFLGINPRSCARQVLSVEHYPQSFLPSCRFWELDLMCMHARHELLCRATHPALGFLIQLPPVHFSPTMAPVLQALWSHSSMVTMILYD